MGVGLRVSTRLCLCSKHVWRGEEESEYHTFELNFLSWAVH
jgi:hypothetical protein